MSYYLPQEMLLHIFLGSKVLSYALAGSNGSSLSVKEALTCTMRWNKLAGVCQNLPE